MKKEIPLTVPLHLCWKDSIENFSFLNIKYKYTVLVMGKWEKIETNDDGTYMELNGFKIPY